MKKSIEARLVGNGNLIAESVRAGRSLFSSPDYRIVARNRAEAIEKGISKQTINALEMEGERGRRGSRCYPIETRFIGEQDLFFLGLKMRLYNIEGDHPQNNSTVGVTTLIHQGLFPNDLTIFGVVREYAKEAFCNTAWTIKDFARRVYERINR